jgi:hypothetical protein
MVNLGRFARKFTKTADFWNGASAAPFHVHGENGRAMGYHATASNDYALNRFTGFWVHLQRGIAHLLLDFKAAWLLLRILRNGFVNVCRHDEFMERTALSVQSFSWGELLLCRQARSRYFA